MIESKIRPIREALCLALFLGLLFLGPLFSAAAQSPRLADVRRQMELGLYREAETAVNEALAQAAQEPAGKEPPLFLRREWRLLLAEIYYHSRQYDRAVEQVQMARGLLEVENRIASRDGYTLAGPRLRTALWKTRIELARARAGEAPAKGLVDDDKIPGKDAGLAVQADWLELLVLRQELSDIREKDSPTQERKRGWTRLRQEAEKLLQRIEAREELIHKMGEAREPPSGTRHSPEPRRPTQARREMPETYASVLLSLARCWELEGNPAKAVSILRPAAIPPRGEEINPRVKELRAETARILRDSRRTSNDSREAEFWQEVLSAATFQTVDTDPKLAQIEELNNKAEIHFQRAESLHLAGMDADAAKPLAESRDAYREAVTRSGELPADVRLRARLGALRTASLQGLLRTLLAPEEWSGKEGRPFGKEDVGSAVELRHLLEAARIADDPLVYQLSAVLGAQYLRAGKTRAAAQPIKDAYEFFHKYHYTAAATWGRLSVLRAEIDCDEGRFDDAKEKLDHAPDRYAGARLEDEGLRLWIEVQRGRLAAARGRFSEGRLCYERVIREATDQTAEAGGMARLGLAALYKGFGNLVLAETTCRQAIAQIPATSGPEARAPFHVALAGILVLEEGKRQEAEKEVDIALTLLKDHGTREGRELRHLKAMLQFMDCKSTSPDKLASEDVAAIARSSENAWLELRVEQQSSGDRPGEARTCLCLSQLYLFRWQQEVLRGARDALRAALRQAQEHAVQCRGEITAFKGRLADYQKKESEYRAEYDGWLKKPAEEQDASHERLKKQWEQLPTNHNELRKEEERLRDRKEDVAAEYETAQENMLSDAAESVGNGVSVSTQALPQTGEPGLLVSAGSLADRAAEILNESPLYPGLHYLVLCNQASLLRVRSAWEPGKDGMAKDCLFRAVHLLEEPRLGLEGDVARAGFLAQYSLAFDQLIERALADGLPLDALASAELCRNRSLLDRFRSGEEVQRGAENAFDSGAQLARELRGIDEAQGPDPPAQSPADARKKTLKELGDAEKQYAEQQQKTLAATAFGKSMFGKVLQTEEVLEKLKRILGRGELVLYYHLGSSNSCLFVLGLDRGPRAVPRAIPLPHVSTAKVERWVGRYLDLFKEPGKLPLASPSDRAELEAITRRLLPRGLRKELAEAMEKRKVPLIVSAAGPLQQLPFDALLVPGDPARPFLIDYLPATGIAYIPSLMVLDSQEDPGLSGPEPPIDSPSVVTTACDFLLSSTDRGSGPLSRLSPLPKAREESDGVFEFFPHDRACRLPNKDKDATKDLFCREIESRKPVCVHLATHTYAPSSDFAPALVFPPRANAANSPCELLKVAEIEQLDLSGCRLAVLSACRTNRGPEISGEMAMGISRAFLVAKARRVVASQWSVEDEAACEFAKHFLREVTRRWQDDTPCNYAAAMTAARRELRSDPARSKWANDPFYWAPFILIGPPCDVRGVRR